MYNFQYFFRSLSPLTVLVSVSNYLLHVQLYILPPSASLSSTCMSLGAYNFTLIDACHPIRTQNCYLCHAWRVCFFRFYYKLWSSTSHRSMVCTKCFVSTLSNAVVSLKKNPSKNFNCFFFASHRIESVARRCQQLLIWIYIHTGALWARSFPIDFTPPKGIRTTKRIFPSAPFVTEWKFFALKWNPFFLCFQFILVVILCTVTTT